ncbi:MAG: hypothetical protein LBL84_01810 [Candidatus Nomurabacteria bacterium]|jgi:type II secretory pathway pseudopilin PulG|nr:hypothetical protein [Candidatus Nomurabacteria bacterium]
MIKFKKGDTIIEVTLAITIFSMVAIGGVTLMNLGVNTAQASLQLVMAREAIDAQAEALRTIHNAYVASSGTPEANSIASRWTTILNNALGPTDVLNKFGGISCGSIIPSSKRFIIDVRKLDSGASYNPVITGNIGQATTFPRLVYAADSNKVDEGTANLIRTEGLWVQAVPSVKDKGIYLAYDFHIRACWNAPGKTVPSTIGTIIRLYNSKNANASISGEEPAECVAL